MSLADSLLIAFDTTVAGLVTAAVCYVIAKIRRRWYDDYMVSLETLMDAVLEEVSSGERKAEKPDQDASAEMQETKKACVKKTADTERKDAVQDEDQLDEV